MLERPLFLAGVCCLAGAAGAFFFSPLTAMFVLTVLCLFGIFLFQKETGKLLCAVCCGLLTCLSVMLWQIQAQELKSYAGKTVQIEGMVTAVEVGSGWIRTEAQVDLLGHKERMDFVSYSMEVPEPGHLFCAVAELEEANPRYNGTHTILQGIFLEFEDQGQSNQLYGKALALRSWLLNRAGHLFHGIGQEVITGLLLGERAILSYEVEEVFEKSGTAHLLTVSGFHISMMAGGLYWLLKKLGQNPKITSLLTIPLIFFLAMVEGWTISVVRAAIMSALYYAATILERDYDGLSAWGTAVIVTLLPRPENLFHLSFLLSFSSVLGILLFQKKIYNFFLSFLPAPKPEGRAMVLFCRVLQLLSFTIAANSLILPFLWYFFGYIPLISSISSLVVVPFMPLIIGTAAAVLFCPLTSVAEFLAYIPQCLAEILYRLLAVLAEWDWNFYGQDDLLLTLLICFCGGIFILHFWNIDSKKIRRIVMAYCVGFCVIWGVDSMQTSDRAELISCRSAAVLIYNNHAVIFGSPEKNGDLQEIEKVLHCAHVENVDILLITEMPRDDGITARELSVRWKPTVTASVVPLDAFDLTDSSYQLGQQQFSFWGHWTLKTINGGALLSNGRKTTAKLHSVKDHDEANTLLYDDYQFQLSDETKKEFTWEKQLKLSFSAD